MQSKFNFQQRKEKQYMVMGAGHYGPRTLMHGWVMGGPIGPRALVIG